MRKRERERESYLLITRKENGFSESLNPRRIQGKCSLPCSSPVWPDLAKFRHFGKIWNVFGQLLKFFYYLAKRWTFFGKYFLLLGKFTFL